MLNLQQLWESQLRLIIANLEEGQQQHREIANIASHITADYHGRFLIELIQNANDQAVRAHLQDSTVAIIRTQDLLAICNQGEPFTEEGFREITSIGLSSKDPQLTLGNKGIGFKSVFQVSSAPEIYSSNSNKTSFTDDPGIWFKLNRFPFEDYEFVEKLRYITNKLIENHLIPEERLLKTNSKPDLQSTLLNEARAAAPFKFPMPLTHENLNSRIKQLILPYGCISKTQTLVVLPLLRDDHANEVVDRAINELMIQIEPTILFLTGVSRLELIDHTSNTHHVVARETIEKEEKLPRAGALFYPVKTSATKNYHPIFRETYWWLVKRTMGKDEVSRSEIAEDERRRIKEAASKLPGENWHEVDTATVQVALPRPDREKPPGTPLGARGLIYIGLPTDEITGTPFWVDAHFHGTISRKGIDLSGDTDYNLLLFNEAVRLAEDLVSRLKSDIDINTRRIVTLAMETGEGRLAKEISKPGGLLQSEIILNASGQSFISSEMLELPMPQDTDIFYGLSEAVDNISLYGFTLADKYLVDNARALLDKLSKQTTDSKRGDTRFIKRPGNSPSLLEAAARYYRNAGQKFWHQFLEWILERFEVDILKDQCILPVGKKDLATPESKVFLPRDQFGISDDDEEVAGDIPEAVSGELRFLDESAVQARVPERSDFTPLARKLAPNVGSGLVKRPIKTDLINDALAPFICKIVEDPNKKDLAVLLLKQLFVWVNTMRPTALQRIKIEQLRVPTIGIDDNWRWLPPIRTYLGKDWQEGRTDQLITRAYGDRCLITWQEFASVFAPIKQADSDNYTRDWWANGMRRIGVADCPRLIRAREKRRAPLHSFRYDILSRDNSVSCPFDEIEVSE